MAGSLDFARDDNLRQQIPHRRLQAAEAKIQISGVQHAPGKIEFFRVTCLRPHFNLRAARITEPKQLRDLIERFPGGVIERGAKNFVIANAPHVDEQTVPATHDQSNVRLDFFAAKKWREQMPFQMIDREKWFAGADGQTFRRRGSDKSELASPGPLVAAKASISLIVIFADAIARSSKRGSCAT